jgi:hypothetical protein
VTDPKRRKGEDKLLAAIAQREKRKAMKLTLEQALKRIELLEGRVAELERWRQEEADLAMGDDL